MTELHDQHGEAQDSAGFNGPLKLGQAVSNVYTHPLSREFSDSIGFHASRSTVLPLKHSNCVFLEGVDLSLDWEVQHGPQSMNTQPLYPDGIP